ncbi:MAG: hypothetical protein HN509_08880 [Halobacteriovoraceae bacterium]|jgi:hypothetical protein|nr:hypothetical protein [Halobacteriovoraceae bacterium]MBT5095724.1 hypothetical protein [Halobacteriovoraceae bacterium]
MKAILYLSLLFLTVSCFETEVDGNSFQNANGVVGTLRVTINNADVPSITEYHDRFGNDVGATPTGNNPVIIPINGCITKYTIDMSEDPSAGGCTATAGYNINGTDVGAIVSISASAPRASGIDSQAVFKNDALFIRFICNAGSSGPIRADVEIELSVCN